MTNAPVKTVRFSSVAWCLVALSFVTLIFPENIVPLGLLVPLLLFWVPSDKTSLLIFTPILILFASILIKPVFWKSLTFILGALFLTALWLVVVFHAPSYRIVTLVTSIPYIAVVSYWIAVSLNVMMRRPNQPVLLH